MGIQNEEPTSYRREFVRGANVVVLMASHNRREFTLKAITALQNQKVNEALPFAWNLVLVDDGSSDGTAESVRQLLPEVHLIRGNGNLFWAKAMALAESAAITFPYTHILWLNDDTFLDSNALLELLAASQEAPSAIIVGGARDPLSKELTYGGLKKKDYHPLRFSNLAPSNKLQSVDTFNGNIVLIPRAAHEHIGLIDNGFSHGYADLDYGLRTKKNGVAIFQAKGTLGVCSRTVHTQKFNLNIVKRWMFLESPKGIPWHSEYRFLRRHGGGLWWFFLIFGYLKRLFFGVSKKIHEAD